jgi:hypothetical protein
VTIFAHAQWRPTEPVAPHKKTRPLEEQGGEEKMAAAQKRFFFWNMSTIFATRQLIRYKSNGIENKPRLNRDELQ